MSWQVKRLEEIASFNLGKMLDDKKNKGDPLPYLANINVRWGEFELNDLRLMRFETSELERFSLKYGDIVMCEGGEPGRCAIWKEQLPKMMYQKALHRIRPHEGIDNQFLYYAFLHKGKRGGFSPLFTGSTIKHLPKEKLAIVEVEIPEFLEQQRIATLLSKYDDLIENNKRRIELLEDSARQLYKEWFVRFRFPGHEHVRIIDGVPEEWKKGEVSQFYRTSSGGTPSRKIPEFYTGEINWVKTQELNNCFIFDTEEKITEEAISKSSAKLHPENSVLVAMYGATIGELGILAKPSTTNQACCALIANADTAHYTHAYLFLKENKTALIGMSKGAAQNNISQDIIKNMDMLMPPQMLLEQFVDIVDPMFLQIKTLSLQIEKLTSARDILLPKLMSGEIAV